MNKIWRQCCRGISSNFDPKNIKLRYRFGKSRKDLTQIINLWWKFDGWTVKWSNTWKNISEYKLELSSRSRKQNLTNVFYFNWIKNKTFDIGWSMLIIFNFMKLMSVGWVLWHINLSRLFNAKSIFMKIVLFQTIQFSISTEFKRKYGLIFKNISISSYSV